MITVAQLLATGLNLPPRDMPLVAVPSGTVDATFGHAITHGVAVEDVISTATSEFLDAFPAGFRGYVSDETARAWKLRNMGAVVVFADGTAYRPMISRASAIEQDRPCWSDLVRTIGKERMGQTTVVLLTTDFKKRLWTHARVGTIGSATPTLVHDGDLNLSSVVVVDWQRWIDVLDRVEHISALGWSKPALRTTLFSDHKRVVAVGLADASRYERDLIALRSMPEFLPALLIAQRPIDWIDPYTRRKP